jgi:hypothetical protein
VCEDSSTLGVDGPERLDSLAFTLSVAKRWRSEWIHDDSGMLRTCELGRDYSIVLMLSMVIGWESWERAIDHTMLGICEPERDDLRSLILSMGIRRDS